MKFPLFADIIDIFTVIFPFYEGGGIYFHFLLNLNVKYGIIFINNTARGVMFRGFSYEYKVRQKYT